MNNRQLTTIAQSSLVYVRCDPFGAVPAVTFTMESISITEKMARKSNSWEQLFNCGIGTLGESAYSRASPCRKSSPRVEPINGRSRQTQLGGDLRMVGFHQRCRGEWATSTLTTEPPGGIVTDGDFATVDEPRLPSENGRQCLSSRFRAWLS